MVTALQLPNGVPQLLFPLCLWQGKFRLSQRCPISNIGLPVHILHLLKGSTEGQMFEGESGGNPGECYFWPFDPGSPRSASWGHMDPYVLPLSGPDGFMGTLKAAGCWAASDHSTPDRCRGLLPLSTPCNTCISRTPGGPGQSNWLCAVHTVHALCICIRDSSMCRMGGQRPKLPASRWWSVDLALGL